MGNTECGPSRVPRVMVDETLSDLNTRKDILEKQVKADEYTVWTKRKEIYKLGNANRKKEALMKLKHLKMCEAELKRHSNELLNIETLTMRVQANKDQQELITLIDQTKQTLLGYARVNKDDIQDTMVNLEDLANDSQEISRTLAQPIRDRTALEVTETDLDIEMQAFEKEFGNSANASITANIPPPELLPGVPSVDPFSFGHPPSGPSAGVERAVEQKIAEMVSI